jgi:hypothetical protein
MLSKRASKDKLLRYIEANKDLFRVSARERQKAEERIALMDEGIKSKDGLKVDYLIGHYAWLYRYVRKGERQKAKAKLEFLELFVQSNKPKYIFDELSKDPDPYLKPVLTTMAKAVKAYEAQKFDVCQKHFAKAAEQLNKITKE